MMRLTMFAFTVCFSVSFTCDVPRVEARPDYLKGFMVEYPEFKMANGVKCLLCHEKDKKFRNNYGVAFARALNGKKIKNRAFIVQALKKVDLEQSATEGKSFGDLIEADELPGVPVEE
ncbi:MAG: hypothetical protein O2955_08190 [Planctomycetota bacterium]|nr:hypothetical protein [Planctomycetota bacterium]MDA1212482.1 hypothetical protein [Planctomycetota bacterium]